MTETDVCVVGGGPAGLTLALLLLRSGLRVTLLERTRAFDREFRGEILQPGALQLLDELGVLGRARSRGAIPLERFQLVGGNRVEMDIDYGSLPGGFGFLLSIPQRHLLEELLSECLRYRRFTYREGASIVELVRAGDRVTGARYRQASDLREVTATVLVAADGRYSKTRRLAGIEFARKESFSHDVLWFRIPLPSGHPARVRVYRSSGNPVLAYPAYPNSLQLGWTLPHGGYSQLADQGFEELRRQILRAAPMFAAEIEGAVNGMRDLTLLDVFSGSAAKWALNGLFLIGDSAHTHGPIGAQGINLAIGDAVVLHPMIIAALSTSDGGGEARGSYEARRRPDIDAITALQSRQAGALLSTNPVGNLVRPMVMKVLARTPVFDKTLRTLAFGPSPVSIRSDLFEARPELVSG